MKGDFTRFSFRPERHYSGVRLQQGRVQLDADWNEQADIAAHHLRATRGDLIGHGGAPHPDHFRLEILDGCHLALHKGHYYVDGLLCENEQSCLLAEQPFLPGVALPREPGQYWVYLDAWERHVTAVEDADLIEPALGGVDTATRVQTIWQVRMEREPEPGVPPELPQRSGGLRFWGRYTGGDNTLYRVEVHGRGHGTSGPPFKWSRSNAWLVFPVQALILAERRIVVSSLYRDRVQRLTPGQWLEVIDEHGELVEGHGAMIRLDRTLCTEEGCTLFIRPFGDLLPEGGDWLRVRAWDGYVPAPAAGPQALEAGLQVEFEPARSYRAGDHFTLPARPAASKPAWPTDAHGEPAFLPPQGIRHHHAVLARVTLHESGAWGHLHDHRRVFLPLTEMMLAQPGVHVLAVQRRVAGGALVEINDGDEVQIDELEAGLIVEFDDDITSPLTRANCTVVAELPWEPTYSWWTAVWKSHGHHGSPGYRPLILDAEPIRTGDGLAEWRPTEVACRFLRQHLVEKPGREQPILVRLVLSCRHIYREVYGRRVYLREQAGPAGGPRSDTFERWFWVAASSKDVAAE